MTIADSYARCVFLRENIILQINKFQQFEIYKLYYLKFISYKLYYLIIYIR